MAGHTIPSSQLYPATYTITASGFTLTNDGIVDDAVVPVGVLVESTGDLVLNANKIVATKTSGGIGVSLQQGGYVQNASGATISGYRGIFATGSAAGTVVNTGTIIAYGNTSGPFGVFGVRLNDGGKVTNNAGGTIHGGYGGVGIFGASGSAYNSASVSGGVAGIFLRGGGSVHNITNGVITASYAVAIGGGAGRVTNSGQINGINLGVEESDGGLVLNNPGGTIKGALGVHIFGAAGGVYNFGTINAGASGTAVALPAGFNNVLEIYPGSTITGTVTGGNTIGGTATSELKLGAGSSIGSLTGIGTKYLNFTSLYVAPSASWVVGASIPSGMTLTDDGTLDNLGVIHTTATLGSGAVLTNSGGAFITGSSYGVFDNAGAATVVNDGQISGTTVFSYGLRLNQGGVLTNQAQGVVTARVGAYFGGSSAATVVNSGKILGNVAGNGDGIRLNAGGTVTNLSGTIGGVDGILVNSGAATITNAGTISGGGLGEAVKFANNFANRLTIDPGAVFSGAVDGGNTLGSATVSTLELASGTSTGTITGIGSTYVNFANFVVDAGATWVLVSDSIGTQATLTDNGTLTNNGTVFVTATLGSGASLTNAKGASLGTFTGGVFDNTGLATVVNAGGLDGVDLVFGGSVTNLSGGSIVGPIGVEFLDSGGTVVNAGAITGENGTAVQLPAGVPSEVAFSPGATFGGVVNGGNTVGGAVVSTLLLNPGTSTGTLTGIGSQYLNFGNFVVASGASWALAAGQTIAANETLTDNGTLTNHDAVFTTVTLGAGASLTNASDGVISHSGAGYAVVANGPATVTNYGGILGGTAGDGVLMFSGGAVTNHAGTISAGWGVLIEGAPGTVVNYAQILGTATAVGVALAAGGTIVNRGGTISGGDGTDVLGGGTVVNFASIVGINSNYAAVYFAPGHQNLLAIAPGSTIVGVANGGNTIGATAASTLELIAGASAGVAGTVGVVGTLGGVDAQYVNFADIVVDPGASWAFQAAQTLTADDTLTDNGTLTNNGIVLTPVTLGAGASLINANGAQITIAASHSYAVHGNAAGTVVNDGLIAALQSGSGGIELYPGGVVTNLALGTITAANYGVNIFHAVGTVINYGVIHGQTGGIALLEGGTVVNRAGTIGADQFYAIGIVGGAGTVVNDGTIARPGGHAVLFQSGYANRVVLGAGAVIDGTVDGGNARYSGAVSTLELTTGNSAGVIGTLSGIGSQYLNFENFVVDAGASWVFAGGQTIPAGDTVTDDGTLTNNATVLTTVTLGTGALLTNAGSGVISNQSGLSDGVDASGPATVSNYGVILGSGAGFGVELSSGGAVTNHAGSISASSAILIFGARGTVTNYGQILSAATRTGIELNDGGVIINRAGTISGSRGIEIFGSGTVVNFATIVGLEGGIAAVDFMPGSQNLLQIAPGSTIVGTANGGNTIGATAVSTLELITGTAGGVIGTVGVIGAYGQAGAQYVNFADIVVDAGASWAFQGAQTLAANETITDNGTLTNNGIVLAPVTLGAGATLINPHGATIADPTFPFTYAIRDSGVGVVVNDGVIAGGTQDGAIGLYGGGTVTNQSLGTIAGATYLGVWISGGIGTVFNSGVIQGNDDGIILNAGGTVANLAGTISATRFDGVDIVGGPGTVANFATIAAGTAGEAVFLAANSANRVVIGAGAVFSGVVDGGNTIGATVASTLELTTGSSAGVVGTIGGIGSQYVNFAEIVVDPGAAWVLQNTQTLAADYVLIDRGALTNNGTVLTGVFLGSAASLTNAHGAVIDGTSFGVDGYVGLATVVNDGQISASQPSAPGVVLAAGGSVTNQADGTIAAYIGVFGAGSAAAVGNAGLIIGSAAGVDLTAGGTLTNTGGIRSASRYGVLISGGAGTVVNSGFIQAGLANRDAVYLQAGFANRVVVDPGASFLGRVDGGNTSPGAANSTLELAAGTQQGRLYGFGSEFVYFSTVTVDAGASWLFGGQNDFGGATLVDAGTLAVNGDAVVDWRLVDTSSVLTVGEAGTGRLAIENSGEVVSTQPASDSTGIDIGQGAGDVGDVSVTGPNAKLLSAGVFRVGDGGLGSLEIESGSTVQTTSGIVPGLAGAIIANATGAAGSSVQVTGAGSDWQVGGGALIVGNAGAGALNIAAGGAVTATSVDLAAQSGSSGDLSLSGTATALTTSGSLAVGDAGAGELSILNGASVTIGGDLDVGQLTNGSGNVDIENASVSVAGNLNLGLGGGAGVVTVGTGGTLHVTGGLIGGIDSALNEFGAVDPNFDDGVNANVGVSGTQDFPGYIDGFASFTIDAGVTLTLESPSVYNNVSFVMGGKRDTTAAVLVLNTGSVSADTTVAFTNAHDTLVLGINALQTIDIQANDSAAATFVANPSLGVPSIAQFLGMIDTFKAGDQIVVDTTAAATFMLNGSTVEVVSAANTLVAFGSLVFDSAANAQTAFNTAGALVDVSCFAAGTRIRTTRGEVLVEALLAGDVAITAIDGSDAPVVWVGHREVDCARHPQPETVWPVRIGAGAFGRGLPKRTLTLSPDHAVYVNAVLVPVKHLINGTTIRQVQVDRVTYYHVELDRHDVLYADGMPAESYLDVGDRGNFANGGAVVRLHMDLAHHWEAGGCAPLVVWGEELEGARAVVAAQESRGARARRAITAK